MTNDSPSNFEPKRTKGMGEAASKAIDHTQSEATTGVKQLDDIIGGLRRKELIVIASRPSSGKTSLALQACYETAKRGGRVLIVSHEMSAEAIALRMCYRLARVDGHLARTGRLTAEELDRLKLAAVESKSLKLEIYDNTRSTPGHIRSAAESVFPLDLVCVDAASFVYSAENGKKHVERFSDCVHELKVIAKEINVPLLTVCHLPNDEPRIHPTLNHLPVSIQSAADVVVSIHHDYDTNVVGNAKLAVLKNRNGKTGAVELRWNAHLTSFESYDQAQ